MFKLSSVTALALFLVLPASVLAVNFYDGTRTEGLYFLTYSSLYYADKTTDAQGKTSKKDYGYSKLEELFRVCYYKKDLVLTAFLPLGRIKSEFYHGSSQGVGDINLGAGYFLPVKDIDLLPMLFVKFPTGEYDSQKSVNYGANQYDIKPALFLYKAINRFSIDGAAKYFFRVENRSTGVSAGDELYLQLLLGWQFNNKFKAGPSLNWMQSGKQVVNGTKVGASQRELFSAGADLYFRFSSFSATFTYLRDLRVKNTVKGDFFQLKTCYKF